MITIRFDSLFALKDCLILFQKSLELQYLSIQVPITLIIAELKAIVLAVELPHLSNLQIKAFLQILQLFKVEGLNFVPVLALSFLLLVLSPILLDSHEGIGFSLLSELERRSF